MDTNTLSEIGKRRRTSEFFQENVVLPEEVLLEARSFPDIATLTKLLYPTTPQVLDWLIQVMKTVPIDDTRLVNLYSNKGSADPLLVACALDGRARDSGFLVAPEWVVVTGDKAVRGKAQEFGLTSLANEEFAALVDASVTQIDVERFDAAPDGGHPAYRSCSNCGAACLPEPFEADNGFRIVFICPAHGVRRVVDPFDDEQ